MEFPPVLSDLVKSLSRKPEAAKTFVALKLSSSQVVAVSWKITGGKVEVGRTVSAPVSDFSAKGFLAAADTAVSQATADLAPEPKEVLFGVPPTWVSDGKVNPDFLSTLKIISRELALTPLGFVSLPEAINNFLREVESVPLTAILVGLDADRLAVTLIRAGKIIATETAAIPKDSELNLQMEQLIKKFSGVEVLPSRILIYDGSTDLSVLKEQILSHPWTQRLPFLHFPKVEVIGSESAVRAVAIAGGAEMGGKIETETPVAASEAAASEETPEPAKVNPAPATGEESRLPEGFIEEADVAEQNRKSETAPEETVLVAPESEVLSEPTVQNISAATTIFSGLSEKLKSLKLPKVRPGFPAAERPVVPNTARPAFPPKGLIIGLLGILLLCILSAGGVFAAVNFATTAKVTVFVTGKNLEADREIVVVTSGTVADSDPKIVGALVETDETGSKKGVTTGHKLVGTKARGTVTVYNSTLSKDLASGSQITGPNGVSFSLDSETIVASGSGVASLGTGTANVTATGIGDSYNLPAGTIFKVADYPSESLSAKNDSAFSGGSSHQAQVVAKQDQDRLIATLSAELSGRALTDLRKKISSSQNLLDQAVTSRISRKSFDRDVDTEADSVTANLTIHYTGIVFDQDTLTRKMAALSAGEVPTGYTLDPALATVRVIKTTVDKNGNNILTVHFQANLLPEMDKGEVRKNLAGKSFSEAAKYLTSLTGVTSDKISLNPRFLARFAMLPRTVKNIGVEIVSQ